MDIQYSTRAACCCKARIVCVQKVWRTPHRQSRSSKEIITVDRIIHFRRAAIAGSIPKDFPAGQRSVEGVME
jgi:hypothetical protein